MTLRAGDGLNLNFDGSQIEISLARPDWFVAKLQAEIDNTDPVAYSWTKQQWNQSTNMYEDSDPFVGGYVDANDNIINPAYMVDGGTAEIGFVFMRQRGVNGDGMTEYEILSSAAAGGNAYIEVVTDVTCTPTGLEISTIGLAGANYNTAVIRQFLALTDVTPKSYLGNQGRAVVVNASGTALEFGPVVGNSADTFIGLTDTPPEYSNNNTYKVVTVSSSNKGVVFSDNNVTATMSVSGGGNPNAPTWKALNLVGDVTTPGSNRYYGTNAGGQRGWYDLSSFLALEGRVDTLETDVSVLQGDVATLQTTVAGHTTKITSLETLTASHSTKITTLEGKVSAAESNILTLQSSVSGLEITVAGHTSSISTLATGLTNAQGSISTLQGQMTTAQGDISVLQSGLSTEITNRTNADNALDGRLDTLEGQTLDTRLSTLEGQTLNTRLNTLESQTLDTRLSTLEGQTLDTRISTLESQTLDTRLATLEGQTLDSRLTALEGQTLDTRLTTLEGQTLDTRLATLEGQTLDTRLSTLEGQTLDTRVATLEGQTLDTRLTTLEGQTLDSRVTTLEGQTLDSRLTTLEGQTLDTRVTTLEGLVSSTALTLSGTQVVGVQQSAIADAVGATIDDTSVADCASSTQTAVDDIKTQLNAVLSALRTHGLIGT